MTGITITSNAADTRLFIVRIDGNIRRRKALNDALGRRLARELQGHFRARNKEPNKLGGRKTNFWTRVAAGTHLAEVNDSMAVVSILPEGFGSFRIHLHGGTIRPTNGRQALTIPKIPEAHGLRVSEYEAKTGHKLFRLPGTRLLFERDARGTASTVGEQSVGIRRRSGAMGRVTVRARSLIRPVYALARQAVIKPDPRALPDAMKLTASLQDEADKWLARELAKGGKGS